MELTKGQLLIHLLNQLPPKSPDLNDQIEEFREWVTPRIDSIEDHDEFDKRVDGYEFACHLLSEINLEGISSSQAAREIAKCCISKLLAHDHASQQRVIFDIVNLVFALTGTTDNNIKCQFSPFLRHGLFCTELKLPKKSGKSIKLITVTVDRIGQIKLEQISTYLCMLLDIATTIGETALFAASFLLEAYFLCIFDCGSYERLVLVVKSLVEDKVARPILEVFATYQLRGSAAAISGHGPEDKLRLLLTELGMCKGVEFNETDVIPASICGDLDIVAAQERSKTRAYDFVIPFRIEHLSRRVFIQSQIYGGDSGSVSHKNVDQIPLSRRHVKGMFENPIFLEYLDGAGYCNALAGDLTKILEMSDTHGFFQGRTAIFVLPSIFREIGLLYPAEVISWYIKNSLAGNPSCKPLESFLSDMYKGSEIHRLALKLIDDGFDMSDPKIDGIKRSLLVPSCALVLADTLRSLANHSDNNTVRIPGIPGLGVNGQALDMLLTTMGSLVGSEIANEAAAYLVEQLRSIKIISS